MQNNTLQWRAEDRDTLYEGRTESVQINMIVNILWKILSKRNHNGKKGPNEILSRLLEQVKKWTVCN